MMDPSSPSSSTSPTDLRRSKRNKFHLDIVAAVHGTSKKPKLDALSVETNLDSKSVSDCTGSGKPTPTSSNSTRTPTPVVDEEPLGKRKRRSTAHFRDYGYIYQDEDEDDKGFVGNHQCKICPARYETKAGLNNHLKLHGGDKRRFSCELCNFSSNTAKAHVQHNRVHKHFGVVSAQTSPVIVAVKEEVRSISPEPPVLEAQLAVGEECNEDGEEEAGPPVLFAVRKKGAKKEEAKKEKISDKEKVKEGLPKNMRCTNCPFVGKSWERLRRHLKAHTLESGYQCAAKNCTYKCATSGFLKRHYTLHKEILPWPPVYVSGSSSSKEDRKDVAKDRLRSLAQIRSSHRTEGGGFKCNLKGCEYSTEYRDAIISHKIQIHNAGIEFAKTPFVCIKCGYRARNRVQLRVHKLLRHLNRQRRHYSSFYMKELLGELYFIKMCKLSCTSPEEVKKEDLDESFDSTNGFTSDVTFHCDLCPYKACSASRVERHRAKHFVDHEFKCPTCLYSCRNQELMNQHDRLHLDNKEEVETSSNEPKIEIIENEPMITEFGKAIKKWSLRLKVDQKNMANENFTRVVMDGQKMFQCVECPYASKYRGDIRGHKLRHTAAQEYRCTQCSYSAQRPVSLRDHFKLHISANSIVKSKDAVKLISVGGKNIGERRGFGRNRIYCCMKCPYTTSVFNCLWRHNRYHKKSPKVHVCSDCDYSSIDKKRMDEHMVIHVANGNIDAFVRRVNKDGRPMPMLSDYSYQMSVVRAADMMNEMMDGEKKSAMLNTRVNAERSTRTKNNYYHMVNNPGRVSTPTPSSSSKIGEEEIMYERQEDEVENEEDSNSETSEQIELSHFAIREFLRKEKTRNTELQQCGDCPYTDSHPVLFHLHRDMHSNSGPPRAYSCCECNYSINSPRSLQTHLKLHWPLNDLESSSRKRAAVKKQEHIPAGTSFYKCRICPFRTVSIETLEEHKGDHIKSLYQRLATVMKRNTPREEYQKPKLRSIATNRNLKCCVKCLFRCNSGNHFVAHADRHGWGQLYRCSMCDYSDPTKSVVDFHEVNHHVAKEHSLTDTQAGLKFRTIDGIVEAPMMEKLGKPTTEEVMRTTGSAIKCGYCDYITTLPNELSFHMLQKHADEPNAAEESAFLNMGFLPTPFVCST